MEIPTLWLSQNDLKLISGGLVSTITNISLGRNVTTSVAVHKCTDAACRDRSIANARSKIGESGYSLLWNNCEHFVRWCVEGVERSHQVTSGRDRTLAHLGTFAAGALASMLMGLLFGRGTTQ